MDIRRWWTGWWWLGVIACGRGAEPVEEPGVPADAPDAPGLVEDRLEQGEPLMADILLVIDDSGSMQETRAVVAASAPRLLEELGPLGVDYHVGVTTTTDPDAFRGGGRLVEARGVRFVTPATVDGDEVLTEMVDLPSRANDAHGFDSIYTLVELMPDAWQNEGFLRPGVPLRVVVVADEDDQSELDAEEFVSWFTDLRSEVTFDLLASTQFAPELPFYASVVDAVGGLRFALDPDEDDWDLPFAQIVDGMRPAAPEAFLSLRPEPGTIEVRLERPGESSSEPAGWSYDATRNAVALPDYLVPPWTLSVRYAPIADPHGVSRGR